MATSVPLLSSLFLVLAMLTTLAVAGTRGRLRETLFLAGNLTLLVTVFVGWRGALSTAAFVLAGWMVVQAATRYPRRGLLVGSTLFVLVFMWMRNYDFIAALLPDSMTTSVLATLGLSFLLFKILHVAIEAKSGTLGPISFVSYINYCVNFTTFSMGPIQRFQDFHAQWTGEREAIPATIESHLDAVNRILIGFVRVYVLGALLQPYIMSYESWTEYASLGTMLLEVYAFYFFLYFNFAGYCDIVIGFGSLMGVRPPENFHFPFLARNVSDFWQRQHRSLTLWLTDYVFTPTLKKAMSQRWLRAHKVVAASLALMLTMVVSGVWHGTTFGFLVFGLVHGALLVTYHAWDSFLISRWGRARVATFRKHPLVIATGILLTFNATAFAFVFFQLGARKGLTLFTNLLT